MELLKTHAPPAFAADLANVPDGLASWDKFMSFCFEEAIDDLQQNLLPTDDGPCIPQFFDAKQPVHCGLEGLIEAPIVWNAFPRRLTLEHGRAYGLIRADELRQQAKEHLAARVLPTGWSPDRGDAPFYFRPQDEYCEWRVERDGATGKITRVTFTCEPPEYWTALYGGQVRYGRDARTFDFPGNPDYATALYRQLTGQDVRVQDLALRGGGGYNLFNRWNSTHGIVHCTHLANSIAGEVQLAARCTPLRQRLPEGYVTNADELICAGDLGPGGRNSDATIGSTANALARMGAKVTLADPVGVYMDSLDVSGWSLPDGVKAVDCWRLVRGSAGMMQRIVIEVPFETGLTLSDMTIGGDPVRYGGQLAECITVKLLGWGDIKTTVRNKPIAPDALICVAKHDPNLLIGVTGIDLPPAGTRPAFERHVRAVRPAREASPSMPCAPVPAGGGGHD